MSDQATRNEDGSWEPKPDEKKGMALPVVVGVALGVGCLLIFCVGGMLAAIAIPNFLAMQLRAKRSELPSNVDALRTAEKAYHAEWDVFTTVEPCPPTWMSLGREQVAWDSTWDCYSQFEALGWTPYGMTRGRYAIVAAPGSTSSDDDFRVTGEADIDGDGDFAVYAANRAEKATMETYNNIY